MKKFVINLVIDTLLTTNKTSKSLDNQPDLLKPFNHCRYFFGSDLLINSSVFLQHKLNGNKQDEKLISHERVLVVMRMVVAVIRQTCTGDCKFAFTTETSLKWQDCSVSIWLDVAVIPYFR